jgi:TldD protein
MELMIKTAEQILSLIPESVSYADCRIVELQEEDISTKDGVVEALSSSETTGYNVRVLKDGVWGFAASSDFSRRGIDLTIKLAIAIADTSSKYKLRDIKLDNLSKVIASYKSDYIIDPFSIPLEQKLNLLLKADKAQRVHKNIAISQTHYHANKEKKYFVSSIGSKITQEIVWTGAGIEASATDNLDFQNRSYPNSFRGQNQTKGLELLHDLELEKHAPRVGQESVDLLTAKVCPTGEFDLILDSNQLALQIHESCGHAVELDRVLGYEASYAGTSFLTPEKLYNFQYGSSIVNLVADATVQHGLGTFGYDDEGVPAQKTYLVKNGIFEDYITSRDTVKRLQELNPKYQKNSNGTVRSSSWNRLPMIRMTNINLEPGGEEGTGKGYSLDELISDTHEGIFMSTNRSWSIDDKRYNFQFGTEIGWEIKNGKKGRMLKNPTYQGITPQFWNSCDAICKRSEWIVWGTPNCGKGQPSQVINTGHGASPARFKKVKVGVVKW